MIYAVMRGEYPFDDVVNAVDAPADRPDLALDAAKRLYAKDNDFFLRHPVVEPMEKGSLVA